MLPREKVVEMSQLSGMPDVSRAALALSFRPLADSAADFPQWREVAAHGVTRRNPTTHTQEFKSQLPRPLMPSHNAR